MGAEGKPTRLVKLKHGQTIILGPEDVYEEELEITLTCDNPKCRRSRNGTPETVVVDQKKVQTDPLALPDSFSHSVKLFPDPYVDAALWFCSSQCTKDYLTYNYVPPKTARERVAEAKRTQEAMKAMQAAKAKKEEPRIWVSD